MKVSPRPVVAPKFTLTEEQRAGLKWLRDRGGTGVFGRYGGILFAGGVWAPFLRSTWNALHDRKLIRIESKRVTVTQAGAAFDCGKTWPRRSIEHLGEPR